jgi:hypothetical protein
MVLVNNALADAVEDGRNRRSDPLTPEALLDLAREQARRVAVAADSQLGNGSSRKFAVLERSELVEVWVIHWPTSGHLDLHDHGGSAGAFVVVDGDLVERHVTADQALGSASYAAGEGKAFSASYVHDVLNVGERPALSVHAYSPPMPGMTFYDLSEAGELTTTRWEDRSDPTWHP